MWLLLKRYTQKKNKYLNEIKKKKKMKTTREFKKLFSELYHIYSFSLSLFGLPLFNNVAHSTITSSYKPENVSNRWFNGQPRVYIQQVTYFKFYFPIFHVKII